MSPPHEPCVLQASMFVSPKRPFHLPIYAQKMAHALISSEPTRVPTPRFCGDPQVLKYLDIYAGQVDLLIEHCSTDGIGNLEIIESSWSFVGNTPRSSTFFGSKTNSD
jgi:hypothetical protein